MKTKYWNRILTLKAPLGIIPIVVFIAMPFRYLNACLKSVPHANSCHCPAPIIVLCVQNGFHDPNRKTSCGGAPVSFDGANDFRLVYTGRHRAHHPNTLSSSAVRAAAQVDEGRTDISWPSKRSSTIRTATLNHRCRSCFLLVVRRVLILRNLRVSWTV